jgi:hypothetical protein
MLIYWFRSFIEILVENLDVVQESSHATALSELKSQLENSVSLVAQRDKTVADLKNQLKEMQEVYCHSVTTICEIQYRLIRFLPTATPNAMHRIF